MKQASRFQADSDSRSKPVDTDLSMLSTLSRDDTFILCPSSSQQHLTCDPTGKGTEHTRLSNNDSSMSLAQISENPFQLIKNISDGSVSLESIPTISLFKPDPEESSPVENEASQDEVSGSVHCSKFNTTAVLGADKLPQSLLFFIKQQHKNDLNKNVLYLGSGTRVESLEPSVTVSHLDDSDDTDTDIVDSSTELGRDKTTSGKCLYSLPTSDTVILDSEKCIPATKMGVQCADTIILRNETEPQHNFNPVSSIHIEMPAVLENLTSISNRALSGDNGPVLPLEGSGHMSASFESMKKTIYLLSSDGQLTAINISPQLLTAINQAEFSKQSEAKETQTELVFGTGNLFFRSFITSSDEQNSCSREPLCEVPTGETTLVTVSDSLESQSTQSLFSKTAENLDNYHSQRLLEPLSQIPDAVCQTVPTSSAPPCNGLVTDKSPVLKCVDCHKENSSKQEFKKPAKTHTKVYQCDLCNATFTRLGNFTRHRKIHNLHPESQPLFKCETCGREFLQRCDLKRHMLIHTKQEPHRCDQCGKGYIRRSDLVVHLRFHNKDKAFKCSMCDKKFFQTGDLSRHIRRAHKPSSQLTCGHCDRKYACETTLIRHMKAVHKDIILHTVQQRLKETEVNGTSNVLNEAQT